MLPSTMPLAVSAEASPLGRGGTAQAVTERVVSPQGHLTILCGLAIIIDTENHFNEHAAPGVWVPGQL